MAPGGVRGAGAPRLENAQPLSRKRSSPAPGVLAHMPRALAPLLVLASLLLVPLAWGGGPALLVPDEGPQAPPASSPVATVVAFENEVYSFTEGVRTRSVVVPSVPWNRVVLTFHGMPGGDPWDRFFGVGIGGAEVLRGTTPRADFTISKDVTEYASLLPPGGTADVNLFYGSYVGAPSITVTLDFYDDASAALVRAPADHVVRPFAWSYFGGNGATLARDAAFPAAAPASATVELSLSGHGEAEFWYQYGAPVPRTFHLYVDGVEIGQAKAMPYVYALLGFSGGTIWNDVVHPLVWWTAPRVLDEAGVHVGIGEIPPYRAEVPTEYLHLLTGEKEVKVVQEGQTGYWITGVNFLLHDP